MPDSEHFEALNNSLERMPSQVDDQIDSAAVEAENFLESLEEIRNILGTDGSVSLDQLEEIIEIANSAEAVASRMVESAKKLRKLLEEHAATIEELDEANSGEDEDDEPEDDDQWEMD